MTELPESPIGQRFSQICLQRGEPVADSERMRLRLQASFM